MNSRSACVGVEIKHSGDISPDELPDIINKLLDAGWADLSEAADDDELSDEHREEAKRFAGIDIVSVSLLSSQKATNREMAVAYVHQLFRETTRDIRVAIACNPILGTAGLGPGKGDPGDPDAYLIGIYDEENDWWAEGVCVTNGTIVKLPCVLMINDKPASCSLKWEEIK